MKRVFGLLLGLGLVAALGGNALALTHDVTGLVRIEQRDMDWEADNTDTDWTAERDTREFGLRYTLYFSDLVGGGEDRDGRMTAKPVSAAFLAHASRVYAQVTRWSAELKTEYDGGSDYSQDQDGTRFALGGDYYFPFGLGLGGQYFRRNDSWDNDNGGSSGDLTENDFRLFLRYYTGRSHRLSLTLGTSKYESDPDQGTTYEEDRYRVALDWTSLFGNVFWLEPTLTYLSGDGDNDLKWSEVDFDLRLGHLMGRYFTLFWGPRAGYYKREIDSGDYKVTRAGLFLNPVAWFGKHVGLSVDLGYDFRWEDDDPDAGDGASAFGGQFDAGLKLTGRF